MNRDRLIQLVREHALEIKPESEFFTLKSGVKSRYYFDCHNLHLTPAGLREVVNCLWSQMQDIQIDAFGGPSIGADPIIGGLTYLAGISPTGQRLRGFMVRKEEKEHGKAGRIIGPIKPGMRCAVIEDITTTGSSALDAVDCVEAFGAKVVHIFCVVDRLTGGAQAFVERNIPFTPLLTIRDFNLE
jgi:orotate phosphoribosyltransferase